MEDGPQWFVRKGGDLLSDLCWLLTQIGIEAQARILPPLSPRWQKEDLSEGSIPVAFYMPDCFHNFNCNQIT